LRRITGGELEGAEEAEQAVAERLADGVGDLAEEAAEHLRDCGVAVQRGVGHDVEQLAAEHAVLTENAAHDREAAAEQVTAEDVADEGEAAAEDVTDEGQAAAAENVADEGQAAAAEEVADEGQAAAEETAAEEATQEVAAEQVTGEGQPNALDGRGVRVGTAEQSGVGGGADSGETEGEGRRDDGGAPGRFEHVATPWGGVQGRESIRPSMSESAGGRASAQQI
jgi:hypothetical protein